MMTNDVVSKGIDYMVSHLNEKIRLDDIASYCGFSKFYFCRVFKAETGESVCRYIKRLRRAGRSIQPASQNGEVFTYGNEISYHDFDYYDQRIKVKEFDKMDVICNRYLGHDKDRSLYWSDFLKEYSKYHNDGTLYMERSYHDPHITESDRCIYDICMTVNYDCPEANRTTLIGGKFLVYKFEGTRHQIIEAYQGIFNIWLPRSAYVLDDRLGFDLTKGSDISNENYNLDICIPVK